MNTSLCGVCVLPLLSGRLTNDNTDLRNKGPEHYLLTLHV